MLHSRTKWQSIDIDQSLLSQLSKELEIHRIIARMLIRRGIKDVTTAREFLSPQLEYLYDPFLLDGMKEAVTRIRQALARNEKIRIYGDYDVDGICSISLLLLYFRELKADVDYYIPNRFREGYGINCEAIQKAKQEGVHLIVSVDTGIHAVKEAAYAKELGIDLIITDHHEPPTTLPDTIVINPKKSFCSYPFKELAGVGVAYKLVTALCGDPPLNVLDLVALGTIADLVPLVDENRILAFSGLQQLNRYRRTGIEALATIAGIEKEITASHIGFALGPRLNASGRLKSADMAVELLTTDDPKKAELLAKQCDQLNQERQQMVQQITEEAIQQIESDPQRYQKAIVVGDPRWNIGVVGIVASRLVEEYYRPVVVLGMDEEQGIATGSARSITGFHLYQALSHCEEHLIKFGGHEMAAGLSLRVDQLGALQQQLSQLAAEWLKDEDWVPSTVVEDELSLSEVNIELIHQLNQIAPFGIGNPVPQFVIRDAQIDRKVVVGIHKDTLKLELTSNQNRLEAVGFRMGELAKEITPLAKAEILGELSINEWNGRQTPQLIIRDMRIPHLQVFDWRSNNRSKWQQMKELNPEKCIFLVQQQTVELSGTVYHWHDFGEETSLQQLDVPKPYVVLVDPPPTLKHFSRLIQWFQQVTERLYFLYGDEDFDSLLVNVPTREQFKSFYQTIYGKKSFSLTRHFSSLQRRTGLSKRMLTFMIQVFKELGFVEVEQEHLLPKPNPPKKALTDSPFYQEQLAKEKVLQRLIYSSYQELCSYIFQQQGGNLDELQTENSRDSRLSRIRRSV